MFSFLHTGLNKGIMHYSGIGPDKAWTLTHHSGKIHSIWETFAKTLPNLQYSLMFIGREHFIFQGCDPYKIQQPLDTAQISNFVNEGKISDPRLQKMLACIETVTTTLNGRQVRFFHHRLTFNIMSKSFFEELKDNGEEKVTGLYSNKSGYCRIARQRKICNFTKKTQCIFVNIFFEIDYENTLRKKYVCGKFNKIFSTRQIAKLKSGEIAGTIGTCEYLRGFEI